MGAFLRSCSSDFNELTAFCQVVDQSLFDFNIIVLNIKNEFVLDDIRQSY